MGRGAGALSAGGSIVFSSLSSAGSLALRPSVCRSVGVCVCVCLRVCESVCV